MIAASAFIHFLLSSGGVVTVFAVLAVWCAVSRGAYARRALFATAAAYTLLASQPLQAAGKRWLVAPFHELTARDVPPGDVVVVLLGSGSFTIRNWSGDEYQIPDLSAAQRTLEAYRVFKLLDARWILSSGGSPDPNDPDQPSGRTMEKMLLSLGVPPERIRVEVDSRTTRDEAVIVKQMLPALGAEHVVLVTSGVHMRRSLAVFRSVGIAPIPAIARVSTHTSLTWWQRFGPTTGGLDGSGEVVHELLGIAYYWLRGWQA